MKVFAFGASDKGLVRNLNEDSFLISGFESGKPDGFCILADGMGGHNAGEVASKMATVIVADELLASDMQGDDNRVVSQITAALDFANNEIYQKSITNTENAGMGTTTVLAYIKGETVYIANIGDSRAYLMEKSGLTQLTVDHSVVQKLVESGSITPADARRHPERNIITKALGTEPCEEYDIYEFKAELGDRILLCSDGLTDMLEDFEISDILFANEDPNEAVSSLIAAANEHGGKDNVTAVLICFNRED